MDLISCVAKVALLQPIGGSIEDALIHDYITIHPLYLLKINNIYME